MVFWSYRHQWIEWGFLFCNCLVWDLKYCNQNSYRNSFWLLEYFWMASQMVKRETFAYLDLFLLLTAFKEIISPQNLCEKFFSVNCWYFFFFVIENCKIVIQKPLQCHEILQVWNCPQRVFLFFVLV